MGRTQKAANSHAEAAADLRAVGPVIKVRIGPPRGVRRESGARARPVPGVAMVDTGASATVVRERILEELGLAPIGVRRIHTASHVGFRTSEYRVRLVMGPLTVEADVLGVPLVGQHVDCLLGRDLLTRMRFVYAGHFGLFVVTTETARPGKAAAADSEMDLARAEFDRALDRVVTLELAERRRKLEQA